ncbi:MAG: metallophosphoesterase [Spirochaetaceae bacterium]|jgi:3',5'-cyclic AMP phosphodiesterase CpdA|nr:metallophosphoesterase [Spirochaetaceae bacterium]
MVKNTGQLCFCIFSLLCSIFYISCENDFLGLFRSEDLDERLKSAQDFPYLSGHKYLDGTPWTNLKIGDGDYSFIFTSDTHIKHDDTNGLENLQQKFIPSDKFVVIGGDLTQSSEREELDLFIKITGSWSRVDGSGEKMPCYPVIGNHDIYFGNWKIWKELIGSTRYRIDSGEIGNTTLLILDSANAFFGNDQFAWLSSQLKSAKQNTFVFSHGTLFVTDNPVSNKQSITDIRERARLISLLSSSNAKAYLSGHIHQEIVRELDRRLYITTENFHAHHRFARIYVHSNGTITYTFEN